MKKFQIIMRVVFVLVLLASSGSLVPRGMAQTNSNSQPAAAQASPSEPSTITSEVSAVWQKIVSWLVDDARSDEANTHIVQTAGCD